MLAFFPAFSLLFSSSASSLFTEDSRSSVSLPSPLSFSLSLLSQRSLLLSVFLSSSPFSRLTRYKVHLFPSSRADALFWCRCPRLRVCAGHVRHERDGLIERERGREKVLRRTFSFSFSLSHSLFLFLSLSFASELSPAFVPHARLCVS